MKNTERKQKIQSAYQNFWTQDVSVRHLALDPRLQTLHFGRWALDTVVDCFRTESEPSFWFCVINLLKILWVQPSNDLMARLFSRDYSSWRAYFSKLFITLQNNVEINFYCEKSNYITSSFKILNCSEAAVHSHLFPKISPENTGGMVLFWSNSRLSVQSSDFILKWLHQNVF